MHVCFLQAYKSAWRAFSEVTNRLYDLHNVNKALDVDVVIVGAGVAGLTLGSLLRTQDGISVVSQICYRRYLLVFSCKVCVLHCAGDFGGI